MKTNLKFIIGLFVLGTCLSDNQIGAQNLDSLYSFSTPSIMPVGLAWDGQYLWNCDLDTIYKLTTKGDVVSSFPVPDSIQSGTFLEWDGNYLWLVNEQSATLSKIDITTGKAIERFNLPSFGQDNPDGYGLAWDGQYLWHSDYTGSVSGMIYKLDTQNGQIISSFAIKDVIKGITWVDGFLYGVGESNNLLYKFESSTGDLLDTTYWEIPNPLGLVWDGKSLWNVSGTIRFGGTQHIYQINNPISSIYNSQSNKLNSFVLLQNYPNPFNPSTTIEFTLPKTEYVELKIYNILGKEVTTLVSNKLNQGNHIYTFDGTNLASGVYYYQLLAGDYRQVKKMILLK